MKRSGLQRFQTVVYILSFFCMGARHMNMQCWSMVPSTQTKSKVKSQLGFDTTLLGALDATFLFAYGAGNYVAGPVEDRFGLRYVVPSGMVIAACSYFAVMALGLAYVETIYPFAVFWAINGFCQATVWTGGVAVMGNWFSKKDYGKVIGSWSCNASVGDVLGYVVAGLMLFGTVRWEYITMTAALFMITIAILYMLCIPDHPPPALLEGQRNSHLAEELIQELQPLRDHPELTRKKGISIFQAWMLPGVFVYSIDYAAVKLLNYGMMFWLPYYLDEHVGLSSLLITCISSLFDIGAIVGSTPLGWLSDRIGSRILIVAPLLIIAFPVFFCFQFGTHDTFWIYFILVPLIGLTVSTASNIISGAGAADLARNEALENKSEALATVTGIMDGTGAFGAACGTFIMGALSKMGWSVVFYFLMGVNAVAFGLLIPYMVRDIRKKTWLRAKLMKKTSIEDDTNL